MVCTCACMFVCFVYVCACPCPCLCACAHVCACPLVCACLQVCMCIVHPPFPAGREGRSGRRGRSAAAPRAVVHVGNMHMQVIMQYRQPSRHARSRVRQVWQRWWGQDVPNCTFRVARWWISCCCPPAKGAARHCRSAQSNSQFALSGDNACASRVAAAAIPVER